MAGINGNFNFGQQGVRQAQNTEGLKSNLESVDGKTKKTGEVPLDKAVWNSENSSNARPGDVVETKDGDGKTRYILLTEDGGARECSQAERDDALEYFRGDTRKAFPQPPRRNS